MALDPNESKADAELRLDTEFGELVHILITKKENASNATKLDLPDTIEEIKAYTCIICLFRYKDTELRKSCFIKV